MSKQQPAKYDDLEVKWRYWPYKPNSKEEGLGRLNLLTPEIVQQAAAEIKTGERICVGWDFCKLEYPPFNRILTEVNVKYVNKYDAIDDEYHFNPQSSSQWDGFRHHGQPVRLTETDDSLYTKEEAECLSDEDKMVWYGGTKASEILNTKSDRLGIGKWAEKGIVGRGVLVDYKKWADKKGIGYSCFSLHQIKLSDIQEILKDQNVELKPGDILFIRIGLIPEWDNKTEAEKIYYSKEGPWHHAGVEATEDMLKFLFDNQFSAVASDSIGFEVFPCQNPRYNLHYHLLAGWGLPIGELFDLEALAKLCEEMNRYTFFFSSVPFNASRGVSSSPNGVAIF